MVEKSPRPEESSRTTFKVFGAEFSGPTWLAVVILIGLTVYGIVTVLLPLMPGTSNSLSPVVADDADMPIDLGTIPEE